MKNIKFSRRALLSGLGCGTVLCTGLTKTIYAQAAPRTTRVAMFGFANGSHPDSAPTGSGETFVLKPHMAPLEPVKSDLVILRDMTLQRPLGPNPHNGASYSIFGLGAPTSIDQQFAEFFADQLPSLEITIGRTAGGGGVIPGLSQIKGSFIPGVRTPAAAYQRIAAHIAAGAASPTGNTPPMTTPSATEQALLRRKSVLDFVKNDIATFRGRLGPEERAKVDFYLDSLRTLEHDVGNTIPGSGVTPPLAMCKPIVSPTLTMESSVNDMPTHNPVYLDIIALAFACNVTRVASAMWGGGEADAPFRYQDIDVADWHSTSHGDANGAAGQQIIKIQAFMAAQFLYFVQKLKSYSDGEYSLLDNTAAVLSTQNGSSLLDKKNGIDHPPRNSPFIVAGSCGGAWKTGRVIDCAGRAHNDAYLSIAHAVGLKVDSVGLPAWCTGPLLA